ncbi:junctional adhesion molecule-like isoform X2 [Numida meleagris]|uniref:junctional adhesion molecule-like isoform X2 n=1 Tax=Numida meleagris TaxID=8996 RepID=UPI000B3D9ED9|nr:junctional adhesion molecule-like isoform X2 [Numida meleagris]XP_021231557.1 junctional adhesion molecule-like isoform X2 [Numida meleagris]XP_021231558.1 junctional adhesion molecule-like isoform X2 [Numida meleagris]XP_021231559.1 junctional adhesion molecule-like isoform X2 [Numida meleagris]XP_021231560.1 junctional adhesion molecule-like isoform X2 [Numida meleagris]
MKVLLGLTLVLTLLGRSSSLAGWVFTEPWLHADAGDSVLLRCLFQDPEATGWTVTKVDWLRVPAAGTQKEEMVFYYYSNSSVPVGRFQGRVQWQGDVSCWDGSIQLQDVQVNDSGRYTCEVRLFQHGSIFKNYTVLRVSPAAQRDRGAESAHAPGHTGVWAVTVCCSAVAVVLAFLAGLSLRKRSAATTALERARNDGSKDKAKEGLYSSIPEAEVPKADQDAGKKRRAEETYITMHPSILRENGVYVELARGVIPAEWRTEGRWDGGHIEQPYSQPQEELPRAP